MAWWELSRGWAQQTLVDDRWAEALGLGAAKNFLVRAGRRRLAVWTFGAVLGAAFISILLVGRHQWFFYDEWDFLAARNAGSIHDLLRPHNQHLSTLPILVYRALYRLVGLRTYLPYQAVVVFLHLMVAALLRVVMRRAGAGPWISTLVAAVFALFGAGYEDIIWAFQIGFVGSLVFGLTQLILADHDEPIDRRDWLALLAGAAALLCSGVGVPMIAVVGLATLVRRGWRPAVLHTIPLGVLFIAWYEAEGRNYGRSPVFHLGLHIRFVQSGFSSTFNAIGQVPGVGAALGLVLVAGFVLACVRSDWSEVRRRIAAPGALVIGAVLFLMVTGSGGAVAFGPSYAAASRNLHVVAALMLPALAVAADQIVRRARQLAPVVLALLLVGVPANLGAMTPDNFLYAPRFQDNYRAMMLTLPRLPAARELPRSYHPEPRLAPEVTIGWLLDLRRAGKLANPGFVSPTANVTAQLRLVLLQSSQTMVGRTCSPLVQPIFRQFEKGQSIGIASGTVGIVSLVAVGLQSDTVFFDSTAGKTLTLRTGPMQLYIAQDPYHPATLCL